MKKKTFIFCCLFALSTNIFSQSKEVEARTLYSRAEDTYSKIQEKKRKPDEYYMKDKLKDYDDVLQSLSEAQKRVGTRPKLTYLAIKSVYDAANEGVYPKSKKHYELILQWIDSLKMDDNYPKEKASEIIDIKLDAQKMLQDPKILNPRFNSKDEAFTFISETIKKYSWHKILDVSWNGKNLITILGTFNGSEAPASRFFYALDITTLKKDTREFDDIYRVNNHYVFANGGSNIYITYPSLSNKFLKLTASEFYAKLLKGINEYVLDKGTEGFDIFLNCKSYGAFGDFFPGSASEYEKKSRIFHEQVEDDYVKAWSYLNN